MARLSAHASRCNNWKFIWHPGCTHVKLRHSLGTNSLKILDKSEVSFKWGLLTPKKSMEGYMNISESVKYVLKSRGQEIFLEFWNQDLRKLLKEQTSQAESIKLASSLKFFKTLSESATFLGVLPSRVRQGFSKFIADFINELEMIEDPKEKTIFVLKVLIGLSSLVLTGLYSVQKARRKIPYSQSKVSKHLFSKLMIQEVALSAIHRLFLKFIHEVEKEINDPDELKKLKFLKQVMNEQQEWDQESSFDSAEDQDSAFRIVESFKNYIRIGKPS